MLLRLMSLLVGAMLVVACGGRSPEPPSTASEDAAPNRSAPHAPAAPAPPEAPAPDDHAPRVIFLGDSLTAGLGLDLRRSFPALIEERLKKEGYAYRVVNAGVSGDTSAGGLRRLEWAMGEGDPKILVIALGGNDGLRGLPPEELGKNLAAIIEQARRRGLEVILAGMEAPPNYGPEYTAAFRNTYRDLARKYNLTLIPFLLEGVAGDPSLNQADGIHPNERGAARVADHVWRTLEPVLKKDRG